MNMMNVTRIAVQGFPVRMAGAGFSHSSASLRHHRHMCSEVVSQPLHCAIPPFVLPAVSLLSSSLLPCPTLLPATTFEVIVTIILG